MFVVVLMDAWPSDRFIEVKDHRRVAAFRNPIKGDVALWIKDDTIKIVAFDLECLSLDG